MLGSGDKFVPSEDKNQSTALIMSDPDLFVLYISIYLKNGRQFTIKSYVPVVAHNQINGVLS